MQQNPVNATRKQPTSRTVSPPAVPGTSRFGSLPRAQQVVSAQRKYPRSFHKTLKNSKK
jgi:hypothetical protein